MGVIILLSLENNKYLDILVVMASKNQKIKNTFPANLIREWDNSDGVNFAIALARITGWLLHVDWWTPSQEAKIEDMKSLRVYVGTDCNDIFDYNGKKRVLAYAEYIIQPILERRALNKYGGVLTRFYSEKSLKELPLRVKPNENDVLRAENAIKAHPSYLKKIPKRINPHIPADKAANFSFGSCAVFAEAKKDIGGLKPIAIMAKKYDTNFVGSKLGFVHSILMHKDGRIEDSWGIQPLEHILSRYGIVEYELDEKAHEDVVKKLRLNSPERFAAVYKTAKDYISSIP